MRLPFLSTEQGSTLPEYALMCSVLLVVMLPVVGHVGSGADNTFQQLGAAFGVQTAAPLLDGPGYIPGPDNVSAGGETISTHPGGANDGGNSVQAPTGDETNSDDTTCDPGVPCP